MRPSRCSFEAAIKADISITIPRAQETMVTAHQDRRPIPDTVTICVTSCGRLDLLARTMTSFRTYNSGGCTLISEDSTNPEIIAEATRTYPEATVLSGDTRLELTGSIDRLYARVETPYLFHLEDDWSFDGVSIGKRPSPCWLRAPTSRRSASAIFPKSGRNIVCGRSWFLSPDATSGSWRRMRIRNSSRGRRSGAYGDRDV